MNDSTSQTSPAWPTRWPNGSFSPLWTIGFVLLFAAVLLALLVIIGIAVGIWAVATHRQGELLIAAAHPASLSTTFFVVNSAAQLVLEAFLVALILVAIPRLTHFSLRELGFRPPAGGAVLYGVLGALGMVVVGDLGSGLIDHFTHAVHPELAEQIFEHLRRNLPAVAFFFFYAAIAQPIAEEMIFRVFIFNLGLRYGGFWAGAAVSGALFGYTHVFFKDADAVTGALLGVSGVILCWVYYRSRNAYASMISHGLFNALSTAALYFAPKLAGG